MQPEPARSPDVYRSIMDGVEANHRAAIEATRTRLAETSPQQGKDMSLDQAGQLPVGSTPNAAAKDLVHKYGRDSPSSVERTPAREPEP